MCLSLSSCAPLSFVFRYLVRCRPLVVYISYAHGCLCIVYAFVLFFSLTLSLWLKCSHRPPFTPPVCRWLARYGMYTHFCSSFLDLHTQPLGAAHILGGSRGGGCPAHHEKGVQARRFDGVVDVGHLLRCMFVMAAKEHPRRQPLSNTRIGTRSTHRPRQKCTHAPATPAPCPAGSRSRT